MTDKSRYTIIDEADEMVQTDWSDEMNQIFGGGLLIAIPLCRSQDLINRRCQSR